MAANWKKFRTREEVADYVRAHAGVGSQLTAVQAFAAREGLECSDLVDGTIHCSAPAGTRKLLLRGKWLLEFHFSGGNVSDAQVKLGLIGP
jgi:hypothetical protein